MAIKIQGSTIIDDSRKVINASHVGIGTTNPTVELDVDGNANISGISTLGTVKISSGIVTAVSGVVTYYGDGSNLTGVTPAGAIEGISVINQNGVPVGTAGSISTLSFEGSGGVTVTGTTGVAGIATVVISAASPGGSNGQIQYNNTGNTSEFAGASQLYYDDTNHRVGISSSTPTKALDVQGTVHISKAATNGDPHLTLSAKDSNGSFIIAEHVSSYPDVVFKSRVWDGSSGSTIDLFKGVVNEVIANSTSRSGIKLNDNNTLIFGTGGDAFVTYDPTPGVLEIKTVVAEPITVYTNDTERLRITSGGNVGIGSTQPIAKLDVKGSFNVSGVATFTTNTVDFESIARFNNHVNLGNNTSDNLTITARILSDLVPRYDGQADLGMATQEWRNLYVDGVGFIDRVDSDWVRAVDIDATGISTFHDTLKISSGIATSFNVTGISTLGTVKISSGIVTATSGIVTYYGDGSGLTNVDATTLVGISSTSFLRSDAADIKTSGNLTFNDNVEATFGTGNDLRIYHDGGNTYISQDGVGSLAIRNTIDDFDVVIQSDDGSGGTTTYIRAEGSTGEAVLYHYGSEKFSTKSTGIDVTGNITVSGTVDGRDVAADGALAASATQPGDNVSTLTNDAGYITSADGGDAATLDGIDSSSFLRSDAIDAKTAGHLTFNDSVQIRLGTNSDAYIFGNGANTYLLWNTVGDVLIEQHADNEDIALKCDDSAGGVTNYVLCDGSTGEAILYHYGTQKLATKSNGIDVTGHTETDTLNVSGISTFQNSVTISGAGNTSTITGPSNLVLDPSPVGVGTTSGTVIILGDLQVDGTQTIINSTTLEVDDKLVSIAKSATNATQANGAGLEINGASATFTYASSGDKWVANKSIEATSFIKNGGASTEFLKADGSVDSSTYITSADGGDAATLDGIDSTSFLRSDAADTKTSGDLSFDDNVSAKFGSGTDNLSIYHNGANSYIANSGSDSGSLYIRVGKDNERVHIQSDNGSGGVTDYFAAYGNTGEARLYHYGNQKLATKSNGIDVTGHTETDTLNVSGIATATSFVKASNSGGFLKADGTEDTNTYLTHYTETNDLSSAVTWANVPDANITETSVTQHQAALSITESQISDLQSYLTTETQTLNDVVGLGSDTSQTITVGTATTGVVIRPDGTLNVSGIATVNSLDAISITLKDSRYLYFGNSSQGSIVYNAADFELATSSGDLNLKGSGSVALFEGNNKKLETTSNGIAVSGIVTATSGVVTYYGDGSQLTGISAGSGISTTGTATFNNINATGVVTSTSFIRAGGTSSQFLKADGSVDSSVYLTSVSPTFWTETGYTGIGTTSAVGIGTRIEIIPYDTQNDGTLSFEGSAGQLFSVSNNLTTGSIFSVNDVSGIPSIDVDADGTIQLAPFSATELVGIGTTNPTAKLHVNGTVALGSSVYDTNGTFGGNGQVLSNVTGFGVSWTTISGGGGSSVWSTSGNDAYYTTGNVGINSTSPTAKLDVNGTLNVASTSTFNDEVSISRATTNPALSIKFGNSERGNLSPLASSFRVASEASYDLRLVCNGSGGTNGDVEISTGGGNGKMALFTGTGTAELYYQDSKKFETTNTGIGVSGNFEKYDTLVGSASTTVVEFTVTVAAKSDHRYTGGVNGASASGYYLDGIESPFLTFTPGRTYRFDQTDSSNSTHQIRFYLEADKTTEYTENVVIHGTAGGAGAFIQIAVTESTPSILYYQCENHVYMGNAAQTNGSTIVDGRHDTGVNASPYDPVHSLSVIGPESTIDLAIVPKGGGAFSLSIPDGTSTGGNKRGGNSVDLQTQRANADEVAGSYGSFVAGLYNKVGTSAFYSAAVGGSYNRCIDNVADCIVVGGGQNEINGSGSSSGILAGSNNKVDNSGSSVVLGGYKGTTKGVHGIVVLPASSAPLGSGVTHGGVQSTILNLARDTTDATPTVIASDSTAASTDNQLVLLNNSAVAFKGTCIAGVSGAGNTKAWEFRGAIKRGANAASTTLVGSVIKDVIAYDAGAAAYDVDFTADTTNGGLKVTVTGEVAPYTIRWVCKIETTELAF